MKEAAGATKLKCQDLNVTKLKIRISFVALLGRRSEGRIGVKF